MFLRTLVPHLLGVLDFWIKPLFTAPTPPLSIHQPVVQQYELALSNYTVFSRLEWDNMSKIPVSGTYISLKCSKSKASTNSGPVLRISADTWHPARSCAERSWTTYPKPECTLEGAQEDIAEICSQHQGWWRSHCLFALKALLVRP